jgi:hypothetical protein
MAAVDDEWGRRSVTIVKIKMGADHWSKTSPRNKKLVHP